MITFDRRYNYGGRVCTARRIRVHPVYERDSRPPADRPSASLVGSYRVRICNSRDLITERVVYFYDLLARNLATSDRRSPGEVAGLVGFGHCSRSADVLLCNVADRTRRKGSSRIKSVETRFVHHTHNRCAQQMLMGKMPVSNSSWYDRAKCRVRMSWRNSCE